MEITDKQEQLSQEEIDNLPKIVVGETEEVTYVKMEITIPDEEWFDKICEEARQEIPKEELFNWWFNTAMKETIERKEKELEESGAIEVKESEDLSAE